MTALQDIVGPALIQYLWGFFTVFLRIGAATALLPAFGETHVPTRVKLGIAFAFTLIVLPAVGPIDQPDTLIPLIGTETLNGLALGIAVRFFIIALQIVGSIAAQSTSLSQILGGAAAEPVPAMGYLLVYAALAVAVTAGLHIKLAMFFILSYEVIPLGKLMAAAALSEWGVAQIRRCFELAFTLAAPFVILSLLYNIALGAINKAMPQLMVAFVGAPLITIGGMFLLALASPIMLATWISALDVFLANPFGAIP